VFARLALRVAEVETSVHLLTRLVAALRQKGGRSEPLVAPLEKLLRAVPNFEYGIGYAESWRGEVIYWLMKGPRNTIFRCEPRDPSLFNWAAMRQAIIRKPDPRDPAGRRYLENILADFPLINKSFNLSYAGHDL
jgi:Ni,Fe-hydrogenase III large subunit